MPWVGLERLPKVPKMEAIADLEKVAGDWQELREARARACF
jgi:hypothetical protein